MCPQPRLLAQVLCPDERAAHCGADLSQIPRRSLAGAGISNTSGEPGQRRRGQPAVSRKGRPALQQFVGAGSPPALPERCPELHLKNDLSCSTESGGGVPVSEIVQGILLA